MRRSVKSHLFRLQYSQFIPHSNGQKGVQSKRDRTRPDVSVSSNEGSISSDKSLRSLKSWPQFGILTDSNERSNGVRPPSRAADLSQPIHDRISNIAGSVQTLGPFNQWRCRQAVHGRAGGPNTRRRL